MAEKKFFVQWGDDKREVVFESDIPYGRFMEVLRAAGKLDDIMNGSLDLDIDIFTRELIRATVITPKELTSDVELAKVPVKVMLEIIENVMAEYQLTDFLKRIAIMLGIAVKPKPKGRSSK